MSVISKEIMYIVLSLVLVIDCIQISCADSKPNVSPNDWFYMSPEQLFEDKQVVELIDAASNGDLEKMDHLVSAGVNPNTIGKYNLTPLFCVLAVKKIWGSNKSGFQHLLELGADPNIIADDGYAISHIVSKISVDAWYLETVLKHKGNPSLPLGKSKYNYATDGGFVSGDLQTPLHLAISVNVKNNPVKKIDLLLSNKSNVNARDSDGATPLDLAISLKIYDQGYLLLDAGADCHNQTRGQYFKRISDKINENNRIPLKSTASSHTPEYWYTKFMELLHQKCSDEWEMVELK